MIKLYSSGVKNDKGRNGTLSEVIRIRTCGMYLRVPGALSGFFPPMCFTSQVHKAFLRAIFCLSRAPAQCSCQAAGASCSQHRLSSFLLHRANYGSRRVWCGYTPSTIGSCFSSPVHQYFTRSFKESIVFRLVLACIRVLWGVFTPILNRLPLCSKSAVFPL